MQSRLRDELGASENFQPIGAELECQVGDEGVPKNLRPVTKLKDFDKS